MLQLQDTSAPLAPDPLGKRVKAEWTPLDRVTGPIKQIVAVLQAGYLTINIRMANGQVTSEEQNKKQAVKHSRAGSREGSTSSTVAWRSPYLQYIHQAVIFKEILDPMDKGSLL